MPGHVQELVLQSFRVDAEALRDLDAIVRQGTENAVSDIKLPKVSYHVRRKDHLSYSTQNLEEVLAERNGPDTRLRSVDVSVDQSPALDMTISFKSDEGLHLEAEGADRARLALLASDIRSLARERMRGRGSGQRGIAFKYGLPVTVMLVTAVALIYWIMWYSDQTYQDYDQAVEEYELQRTEEYAELSQTEDAEREALLRQVDRVLADGSLEDKIDLLVQQERQRAIRAGQQSAIHGSPFSSDDYPEWPEPTGSWLGAIGPALLLVPPATGALAYVLLNSLVLRSERAFLIGAEVERHAKLDRRRDRLIWAVGVAFVIGVASSLVVALWDPLLS